MILGFLSDFGLKDPYVGIVKAVVLGSNPALRIVDISHQVAPQDVIGGSFVLGSAFREFPSGTVFFAIVDPGVGSQRTGLLAVTEHYTFLAPDNGLLSMVFRYSKKVTCFSIENTHYFRHPVSDTFHGRDIFAPVAAHLTLGVEPQSFGPPCPDPVRLPWPEPVITEHYIEGEVIYIDGFGSLILNIAADLIQHRGPVRKQFKADIKGMELSLLSTYSDVAKGKPIALIGSSGFLEVAINQGSAAEVLGAGIGEPVVVRKVPKV
ncbi:MAG: SAM-dependent chlorinase/fluorinase [Deltaproteobacteria bacterium]|nr:SAM-dependent chlorinase/fluorinase [Deltaproteobacteria bacterium]MBW1719051.1 SAM-dependent chlorinase/fluorinase [Deltaproteobacteria bacterium]MBW1932843.1 SAM-dependent chlorinase/fluorinase [Deltaproteobacteria bacterium]MBW1938133.1 SAM-dependent chlorinase/fluorinase [Deltaproteobacteria bacterium]MBW1965120.1 SAM-dependent chlorinase/fluorinase [Deltaproteobacteria bacterium]